MQVSFVGLDEVAHWTEHDFVYRIVCMFIKKLYIENKVGLVLTTLKLFLLKHVYVDQRSSSVVFVNTILNYVWIKLLLPSQ